MVVMNHVTIQCSSQNRKELHFSGLPASLAFWPNPRPETDHDLEREKAAPEGTASPNPFGHDQVHNLILPQIRAFRKRRFLARGELYLRPPIAWRTRDG